MLQVEFTITLESYYINLGISKLKIKPIYPELGIEVRYINKNLEELSSFYVRLINQSIFKYQTVFAARFAKQDEDFHLLDETEIFINLYTNHKLTETDNKSRIKHQIEQQEMKNSGWRLDKINSMTIYFYKTGEIVGRSFLRFLRDLQPF